MFRIPAFYKIDMSFNEAVETIKARAKGDLLEGMKSVDALWEDHCSDYDADDSDFYDNWCYEVSAYNVVFENMSKLF